MPDLMATANSTRTWACYDCGKCTASCPITRAGARYSPRRHVLSTNLNQWETIADSNTLDSCLTCMQCDIRCPAAVDYTALVQQLRVFSHTVATHRECPHGGALQSVMRMMAHGQSRQNRLHWIDSESRTSADAGSIMLWTGCTMYYDAFFPELELSCLEGTRAAITILNALGEAPVVSPDERCCGHDLLWSGDRESFDALARANVKTIVDSGAETVVTTCAECLRTLKVDYEPYFDGRGPRMLHLAEYLVERQSDLELTSLAGTRVTFQDPCRLGRHLGVYEEPRRLLEGIPDLEILEMPRNRQQALCCAGGTWGNCDRFAKQIQLDRLAEGRSTGASVMVTACPKCQIHFTCAMKDPNLGDSDRLELRDLAEIVAASLQRRDNGS